LEGINLSKKKDWIIDIKVWEGVRENESEKEWEGMGCE